MEVQPPKSSDPVITSEQNGTGSKKMVNGNINPPGAITNPSTPTDDQNFTQKKVVKVVRRVVRKVLPAEEDEVNVPTQKSVKLLPEPVRAAPGPAASRTQISGFSFKHDVIKTEDKDDITGGLTNLLRGRTREPVPWITKKDRSDKAEIEKQNDMKQDKAELEQQKEETIVNKSTQQLQDHNPTSSDLGVKEVVSLVFNENRSITSGAQSRPLSLPSMLGFIPSPKSKLLRSPSVFAPKPAATMKPTPRNPPSPAQSSLPSPLSHPDPQPSGLPAPLQPNLVLQSLSSRDIPIHQTAVCQQKVQWSYLACLVSSWTTSV